LAYANLKFDHQRYTEIPTQEVKYVHYNWGWEKPINGSGSDYYTDTFDQSVYYLDGDYFIQAFAEDDVKVELDNQMYINRCQTIAV
jgi:hypothetical protein